MGLIASLDIGSEKMVMAVASQENGNYHLAGIKMIALQGVTDGVITDKAKVKSYIKYLIQELAKDKAIDRLKMSLSGAALRVSEHKVNVLLQRKNVKEGDLARAENKCIEAAVSREDELVDILPVSYQIDRGMVVAHPVGVAGRSLDVHYRVYLADAAYLMEIRALLADCGIEDVEFFPPVRAYMEALDVCSTDKPFALIDMGSRHTAVMLWGEGMLKQEVVLPLGTHAVDTDIMKGFRIESIQVAKQMKHQYGIALRSMCKTEKIAIPEVKKQIEKRDLAKVIQCRMEELLEGAIFQLQQWRFNDAEKEILLTGGGSRVIGTDTLLAKLSGHKVRMAKVKGVISGNEEILSAPACLIVLGLLLCEHIELEEEKGGIGNWFSSIFK
ncbi:cell division FtsA domain-containing protein [Odoribacter laneus]|uniref:cell division FtsA domain-containing protein n=1 Tax=Odoribacter laneus TaxID=626933 RepID=UPI003FEE18BC